jgi:hypothetical protein
LGTLDDPPPCGLPIKTDPPVPVLARSTRTNYQPANSHSTFPWKANRSWQPSLTGKKKGLLRLLLGMMPKVYLILGAAVTALEKSRESDTITPLMVDGIIV